MRVRLLCLCTMMLAACGGGGGDDGGGGPVELPPLSASSDCQSGSCSIAVQGRTDGGITTASLFEQANINGVNGNVTFGVGTVDINQGGSGHGVFIDGTALNSPITGSLTWHNNASSANSRIYVSGTRTPPPQADATPFNNHITAAALYLKSANSITITNRSNLLFTPRDGSRFNDGLVGIVADINVGSSITIYNHARVGFANGAPAASRGRNHKGILVNSSSNENSTILVTLQSSSVIDVRGGDSSSHAIFIDNVTGTATISNNGVIHASGNLVHYNNATPSTNITFFHSNANETSSGGWKSGGGNDRIRIGNQSNTPSATGSLRVTRSSWGAGDDEIHNYRNGTLTLGGGSHDFGAGTDAIYNRGTLILGDGASPSNTVRFSGLERFDLHENSVTRLYLTAGNNNVLQTLVSDIPLRLQFVENRPPVLEIHLPSNDSSTSQGLFDLWDITSLRDNDGNAFSVSQAETSLTRMATVARIFSGGTRQSWLVSFIKKAGNDDIIQAMWGARPSAASLRCSSSVAGTVSCRDGTSATLADGIDMAQEFLSVGGDLADGAYTGAINWTFQSLNSVVNSTGTSHGITMDGTTFGSLILGNMTITHQTTGTKRDVQVRGANKAALYVKSSAGVSITNGANLVFAGTTRNNGLRGIEAIAAGTGNLTIVNNSGASIGFASNCTASCGTAHRGIVATRTSSGTMTITNSGSINLTGSGTNSHGIYANVGSTTGDVTVTNQGSIATSGDILHVTGNGSADVDFVHDSSTALTGGFTFGAGDDTLTNKANRTMTITAINAGGGTDIIDNYGILSLGSQSQKTATVTMSSVDELRLRSDSVMRLYLTSSGSHLQKIDTASALTLYGDTLKAVYLELHLPNGFTVSQTQTAFDLWDVTELKGIIGGTASASNLNTILSYLTGRASLRDSSGANLNNRLLFFAKKAGADDIITLSWISKPGATPFNCQQDLSQINCRYTQLFAGLGNGIKLPELFARVDQLDSDSVIGFTRSFNGNLTVNLSDIRTHVNSSGTSHGIELDGTVLGSRVTGGLTLNRLNTETGVQVEVRGANKAAIYVKSAAGVTITNGTNLVFAGTTRNNGLRGIEAISAGTGNVSVTNSAAIGFATNCSSNCGTTHRGILASHAGSGTVSITNSGTINLTGSGTAAHGIRVEAGTATAAVTVANTGTINVSGAAVSLTGGASNDTARIRFNTGSQVTAHELLNSSFAGTTTITIGGGTATGRITAGGGSERIIVNGGTLTLANGTSNFGSGTDSLTMNKDTTLIFGDATNGSDGVSITGLETLTVNAGGALRFYLDSTFNATSDANAHKVNISGTVTLNGTEDNASKIEIVVPAGYTIGNRTAFTLIDATTLTAQSLTALATKLRVFKNDISYDGTFTLREGSGETLQVTWSNLVSEALTCANSSGSITCNGGFAAEVQNGLTGETIFSKASVTTNLATATIGINNLKAVVNSVGTGHGIFIDGTASDSRVTGNVTVTHQTTTAAANRQEVQVRGTEKAALYVKSAAGVSITNAANLVFKGDARNLRGIYAESAGTGSVTVTNSGALGFATACFTNCATHRLHRGILVVHEGTGTVTITNSGGIIMGKGENVVGAVTAVSAIRVSHGATTGAITITNTGNIWGDGVSNAVHFASSGSTTSTATVNFNGGTVRSQALVRSQGDLPLNIHVRGGSASGVLFLGDANETVTVSGGTLGFNVAHFNDGTDALTVNNGGTLAVSKAVIISGLETFTINAGGALRFFLDSAFTNTSGANAHKLTITSTVTLNGTGTGASANAPKIEIVVPSGYTIGNRVAFTLIDATTLTVNAATLAAMASRARLIKGSDIYKGTFTFSEASNERLQVSWSNIIAESLVCGRSNQNISCAGGIADVQNGITGASVFTKAGITTALTAATITISNVNAIVNSAGTGHGIFIDGTDSDSRVTGNVSVTHQTTGTKRDVQVRGANKAALYVKSSAGVSITNGANLVFAGTTRTNGLRGIEAIAAGTGNLTIVNNSGASIGFSANCTASCGVSHRGIVATRTSSGTMTITNSGGINLTGSGTGSHGIYANVGSTTGDVTVTNNGSIATAGDILHVTGNGAADVSFVHDSSTHLLGSFTFGAGDDTLTNNANRTMTITAISMGDGMDTINNYGTLILGSATTATKDLTMTSLDQLHLRDDSTLRLYLTSSGGALETITTDTALSLYGSSVTTAYWQLYLPSGFTVSDTQAAFDVWDITSISGIIGATANATNLATILANMTARAFLFDAAGNILNHRLTFAKKAGNDDIITLAWRTGTRPTSLRCAQSLPATVNCSGGNQNALNGGIDMRSIFRVLPGSFLSSGSFSGNLIININNVLSDAPTASINGTGTGHGIFIDGTATGSQVTGSVTVIHQTTGTKRNVQVRGANKAALYVKSAAGVSITNGANLVFAGTTRNNGLRGIEAIAAGTGNMTIVNSGASIGFGSNCTASCGVSHRGIVATRTSSGTMTITNSGSINLTGSGTSSHGIYVNVGSTTGDVTVTNQGSIATAGDILHVTGNGSADVSFVHDSSTHLLGSFTFGAGDDTLTNNARRTLALTSLAMGGGTDTLNNYGTLILGSAATVTKDLTLSGLETILGRPSSAMGLFLDYDNSAFVAIAHALAIEWTGHGLDGTPALDLYLPSDYTVAAQTSFVVWDASSVTIQGLDKPTFWHEMSRRSRLYRSDGTLVRAALTIGEQTGGKVTAAWSFASPSSLTCGITDGIVGSIDAYRLGCSGGISGTQAGQLGAGIDLRQIFKKGSLATPINQNKGVSLSLNSLAANVNTSGTGHGIFFDGTDVQSSVSSSVSVTINNQSPVSGQTVRSIHVKGDGTAVGGIDAAAFFVRMKGVTSIDNYAPLLFAKSGDQINNRLAAMMVDHEAIGNLTINNHAAIGFDSTVTVAGDKRGNNHRGIMVRSRDASRAIIANRATGTIDATGSASSSHAIYVTGNARNVTVFNFGLLKATGDVVHYGDADGASHISFYQLSNDNDRASGITTRGGNDTVSVGGVNFTGGRLNLKSLAMGAGNDVVHNHRNLIIGDATQTSDTVTISGVEQFHLHGGSHLRLYLDYDNNAFTQVTINSIFNLYGGEEEGSPIIELVLPSDYTNLSASSIGFLQTTSFVKKGEVENLATVLERMGSGLILYNHELLRLAYDDGTVAVANNAMTFTWTGNLILQKTSLTCRYDETKIELDCTGGTVGSGAGKLGRTIDLGDIFDSNSPLTSPLTGTMTVSFYNLAGDVNGSGTGHGIIVDGTNSRSTINGALTVLNQPLAATDDDFPKRKVFVKGDGTLVDGFDAAAIYVKPKQQITLGNRGILQFAPSGTSFRNGLVGMYVEGGSLSTVILVENISRVGFAADETISQTNRGTGHRGIVIKRVADGVVTITSVHRNRGNREYASIDVRGSGTSSHGIYLTGGASAVTVLSDAPILATGDMFHYADANGVAPITFFYTEDVMQQGSITTRGGNDTLCIGVTRVAGDACSLDSTLYPDNISNGFGDAKLNLTAVRMGAGNNDRIVNRGRLILGTATTPTHAMPFTGVESLHLLPFSETFLTASYDTTQKSYRTITIGADLELYKGENNSRHPRLHFVLPTDAPTTSTAVMELMVKFDSIGIDADDVVLSQYGNLMGNNFYDANLELLNSHKNFTLNSNGSLMVKWRLDINPSSLSCTNDFACTGGRASGEGALTKGISWNTLSLERELIDNQDRSITFSFDNLASDINTTTTGHGIDIDAIDQDLTISGDIAVNHQAGAASVQKRRVFVAGDGTLVGGFDAAAMRVVSSEAVTIDNQGDLFFRATSRTLNNSLVAIYAESRDDQEDHTITINNRAAIGAPSALWGSKDALPVTTWGSNHAGVIVKRNHDGVVSLTNHAMGVIDVSVGSTAHAIVIDGGNGDDITIKQQGRLFASGNIVRYASGTADIAFTQDAPISRLSGGSITTAGGNDQIDIGCASGCDSRLTAAFMSSSLSLGAGNDNLTNYGTLYLTGGGNYDFGDGSTDNFHNYGTLWWGNVNRTSDQLTLAGVPSVNLYHGSTTRFYLARENNAFKAISMAGNLFLGGAGVSTDTPVIDLVLPPNYNWTGAESEFDLITATSISLAGNNDSAKETLRVAMSGAVRFFDYLGQSRTATASLTVTNDGKLQISWSGGTAATSPALGSVTPSSLTCGFDVIKRALACHGGGASLVGGIVAPRLFKKAGIGNGLHSDATIYIDRLTSDVNGTADGHGIEVRGATASSHIMDDVNLNHQTRTRTNQEKKIFVTGDGTATADVDAAAIYVSSQKGVGVTSWGALEFEHQGSEFNDSLVGIYGESRNNGAVTIVNGGRIGFGDGETVTNANRGVGHRGIFVKRAGNGAASITNSGIIDVTSDATSHAIYVSGGTGDITITNQGELNVAGGDIFHYGDTSGTANVVFHHVSRQRLTQNITLRDGDDTIRVGDANNHTPEWAFTKAALGSGDNVIDNHGMMAWGAPSQTPTITGDVAKLQLRPASNTVFYIDYDTNAFTAIDIAAALELDGSGTAASQLPTMTLVLPSDYTLTPSRNAFAFLSSSDISYLNLSGANSSWLDEIAAASFQLVNANGYAVDATITLEENDNAIELSWADAAQVADGRVYGAPSTKHVYGYCLYDQQGGNGGQKKYASYRIQPLDAPAGVNRCGVSLAANYSPYYKPRIPFSGQFLHGLLASGKTLVNPNRLMILDAFSDRNILNTLDGRNSNKHGDHVRRYMFEDSFFSTEADLRAIGACEVDDPNSQYLDSALILGCFAAAKRLSKGRIFNTSFSIVGAFVCAQEAARHDWIIVTAAGNHRITGNLTEPGIADPSYSVSECNGASSDAGDYATRGDDNERAQPWDTSEPSDDATAQTAALWKSDQWTKWQESYRMVVVTELGETNAGGGEVNYSLLQAPCAYTKARCVGAVTVGGGTNPRGTSFTAPQVTAVLHNLYAVWNHLWKPDDPSTTNVNESDPSQLVKLLFECASRTNASGGSFPSENDAGHGLVSYSCLTNPVGTISLPSAFRPSGDAADAAPLSVNSTADLGGLVVAGSQVAGGSMTIYDSYQRDFKYNFSHAALPQTPLWRRALFDGVTADDYGYFAQYGFVDDVMVMAIHEYDEARLMLNDGRGLFASLTVGQRGGNDFHGSGLFQLDDVVKTRVGYHQCHEVADELCVMTHASWEMQQLDGAAGSLVQDLQTHQYDFALGTNYRHEMDEMSVLWSVRGLVHSTPDGSVRLTDGNRYAISGGWDTSVSSELVLSW